MIDRDTLCDLIEDAGYECADYSGRCMFGDRCVSMRLQQGESPHVAIAKIVRRGVLDEMMLTDNDKDLTSRVQDVTKELIELAEQAQIDQLGLGHVVYWPKIDWRE